MIIKVKDVMTLVKNSRTKQDGTTLKRKKLKEFGITIEQLMDMKLIK